MGDGFGEQEAHFFFADRMFAPCAKFFNVTLGIIKPHTVQAGTSRRGLCKDNNCASSQVLRVLYRRKKLLIPTWFDECFASSTWLVALKLLFWKYLRLYAMGAGSSSSLQVFDTSVFHLNKS